MNIDIIIPTYKRKDAVIGVVEAVVPQMKENDRMYIVWQGKNRPDIHNPCVQMLYLNVPNLPKARNTGLQYGTSEIVLFLDDDVRPKRTLLNEHRKMYKNNRIGGVAGYVEDSMFTNRIEVPSYFNTTTGECIQKFSVKKSQETISVMGANMSFRRDLLEQIGGFDTNFKGNALWEDVDMAFRIRKTGYLIWYNANARVKHLRIHNGGCRSDHGMRYVFDQFANTAYFACKYAEKRYYLQWLRYWKYRLEYIARREGKPNKGKYSHNNWIIAIGGVGTMWGIIKYNASVLCK